MKKLVSLIVVALFATVTFAQNTNAVKADSKAPQAKTAMAKMSHECYMMKDGALMHCTGDKSVAQKEAVTLKNGTVVSTDGSVKMKDGKESKLTNGECISMMGSVGDCEKMHAAWHQEKKEKMGEAQPK